MKSALIIGLVAAVAVAVVGLYIRRRNMTFEGVVTDKNIRETVNDNTNLGKPATISFGNNVTHQYNIKVQKADGKIISWQISEGKYQIVNIGDHVSKRSGTTDIEITPKAQTTTASAPPTNQPPANTIAN